MKYSIQETGEKITPYKLFRYDEYAGVPNNAELEFWMRIQELEDVLATIFHSTSCTTYQMELIDEVLPQKVSVAK